MSDTTKPRRGHPSPMMFVSIGIGTVAAVALIVIVSILTGSAVKNGAATSELVGTKVPGFSLSGLNAGTQHAPWTSGHAGVLIFFASYCGPCHKEMPEVATYLRHHDQKPVVVMGIDAVDARSSGQAFVKKSKVTFPVAFDPNGVVTTNIFKFENVPETVFVSHKGIVEQVYFGAIPVSQLKSGLAALH